MSVKNKLILFLSFLTLQVFALGSIKIITHNVLAFSGHPKKIHQTDSMVFAKAVDFYKNLQLDIIILQECPPEQYIKKLAKKLNSNYVFFEAKYPGNTTFPYGFPGCIITKYPIVHSFDVNVVQPNIADSIFQRHAGQVIIKTEDGPIQITGIHLCANWGNVNRESTRMSELDILFSKLPSCDSCIANIIAGDFNSLPESAPYNKMLEAGYIDTHAGLSEATVPVPNSTARIDYIFIHQDADFFYLPVNASVPFYDNAGLYLSDHQPCLTVFSKNDVHQ
jgi:endonuclease/exonuclease/phosphatase family metal-dependent hydrolase